MIRWLLALFGIKNQQPTAELKPAARPQPRQPVASSAPTEKTTAGATMGAGREFLRELVAAEPQTVDLQTLPADDRVFLSGILKRIRENQLTIPLLPQAAIEISRLLGNPNSHLDDFVRILESDPALSIDVLRIANSAFYGFSATTQSVHQAVVRIGLSQIRGLIIVAHLHGRVLQGSAFHTEAGLLSSLSMALAQVAQDLSAHLHLDRDAAFTRGVLSHVEHFIIMGTASEVSKEHHRKVTPSTAALLEAFRRFGPRVRELAATAWGLTALMLGGEGDSLAAYPVLTRTLVSHWTGEPLGASFDGIPADRLEAALRRFGSPEAVRAAGH